jgi:hypothetical protein
MSRSQPQPDTAEYPYSTCRAFPPPVDVRHQSRRNGKIASSSVSNSEIVNTPMTPPALQLRNLSWFGGRDHAGQGFAGRLANDERARVEFLLARYEQIIASALALAARKPKRGKSP